MSDLPHIDDELISAYIDGEVSDAERAAIEADENSMAQVAALRMVQAAVSEPVTPLADADRERIVAAALAESATSTTVTSLTAARERRLWTSLAGWGNRNWKPAAAIAAAVALVALAVPIARNLGDDAEDTATTELDAPAEEPAEMSAEAVPAAGDATRGDDGADEALPTMDEADMDFEAATEEAAAEPPEEPVAAEPAEEPAEEPAVVEFAPLPIELGELDSIDAVFEEVFADYEAWLEDPGAASEHSGGLDAAVEPSCLEELMLDDAHQALMSDRAAVIVAGRAHIVWLFEDGVAYVAPVDSCGPVTSADFFDG